MLSWLWALFFATDANAQLLGDYLLFAPEANEIRLSDPQIEYDFTRTEGFRLGPYTFKYADLVVKTSLIQQRSAERNASTYLYHRILGLFWPKELVDHGELTLFSPFAPDIVYKQRVDDLAFAEWLRTPRKIVDRTSPEWGASKLRRYGEKFPLDQVNIGIYPVENELKTIIAGVYQFCVQSRTADSQVKVCSPYYAKDLRGRSRLSRKTRSEEDEVWLNGEKSGLQGSLPFTDRFDLRVQMRNGFSLEVRGEPHDASLVQIMDKDGGIEVIGYGPRPARAKLVDDRFRLLEAIGWKDTILPEKKYWILPLSKEQPYIPAISAGAGFIGRRIESTDLPQEKHRIKLNRPQQATYNRKLKVFGVCEEDCRLRPRGQDTVEQSGREFVWEVHLAEKQDLNKVHLGVLDGDREWVAQHEIFRAASTEISGRLSWLVTTGGEFTALGELGLNHWFETLLGWQNTLLSKQRWGVSVKYFQSLTDIVVAEGVDPLAWKSLTADLRYRLTPGVWGLRETVGLIASYNETQVGPSKIPLLGGGAFWAKSMPAIFDRMMSWLPFMDYPKWVDMEFLIYPMGLDANYEPQLFWNLNFHGKVLWSKTVFGEAGFGFRNMDYIDVQRQGQFRIVSLYATFGLGIQF